MSKKLRGTQTVGVHFGDVVYEPGGTCGPRVQQHYQLVAVIDGKARVSVGQDAVHLAPGEVGLFLPGRRELFRFSSSRRTHHTWCSVHPGLVRADTADACVRAPAMLPMSERFSHLMELGLSLPATAGRDEPRLVESLGLSALHEYLHAARQARVLPNEEPDAIPRALEWIARRGNEETDLRSLARASGVSPSQLVKVFRRHLGTTPIRYVWESRTRQGIRLLRETGLTVAEVAWRCGFQTPFHFSRWVKTLSGHSPKALREQAWNRPVNI